MVSVIDKGEVTVMPGGATITTAVGKAAGGLFRLGGGEFCGLLADVSVAAAGSEVTTGAFFVALLFALEGRSEESSFFRSGVNAGTSSVTADAGVSVPRSSVSGSIPSAVGETLVSC